MGIIVWYVSFDKNVNAAPGEPYAMIERIGSNESEADAYLDRITLRGYRGVKWWQVEDKPQQPRMPKDYKVTQLDEDDWSGNPVLVFLIVIVSMFFAGFLLRGIAHLMVKYAGG